MKNTFEKDNPLLIDLIYKSVQSHDGFVHAKSVFPDKWYNFIIPNVLPTELDWDKVEEIFNKEKQQGVELSFYVPEILRHEYAQRFQNELGSDFGVYYQNKNYTSSTGSTLEIDNKTFDQYLEMVQVCFPEWSNNKEYSKYFYNLSSKRPDLLLKNFMYYVDKKPVGFGSLSASPKLNLAYIHNTGILPEYRRQGYFSDLIRQLTSYANDNGISTSYALVEDGGSSFRALQKIGFVTRHKYYLFEME